jgi:hypothetical protein
VWRRFLFFWFDAACWMSDVLLYFHRWRRRSRLRARKRSRTCKGPFPYIEVERGEEVKLMSKTAHAFYEANRHYLDEPTSVDELFRDHVSFELEGGLFSVPGNMTAAELRECLDNPVSEVIDLGTGNLDPLELPGDQN